MTKMTRSGGNPFADVGLPNADELLAKTEAIMFIKARMRETGMKQVDLARQAGLSQSNVSEMLAGHLNRYGTDRVNRLLAIVDPTARVETRCVFRREAGLTAA